MITEENVVVRLKQSLRRARSVGFKIRMEMLDEEQASWCEIGGVPTLFVDLSQTAAEQLQQVDETLSMYLQRRSNEDAGDGMSETEANPRQQSLGSDFGDDLEKRAA